MFHVPEEYRKPDPRWLATQQTAEILGNNGFFIIPHYRIREYVFIVQASDGTGIPDDPEMQWEHVSISVAHQRGKKKQRNPTWEEMCWIKDLFWDEEDRVVQFHPPKSEYVSLAPYCLHLWRWVLGEFPHPPSITVGPEAAKKWAYP